MSKDQHNGDTPKGIDEALEVRIVAWLLGEASEFEQAELEAMVRDDAAVRAFHGEMKALVGDARSAHGMDGPGEEDWKLPDDRRDKVLAELGATPSRKKSSSGALMGHWPGAAIKRRMQWISMAAAVALFGFGLWAASRMMFTNDIAKMAQAESITVSMASSADHSVNRPAVKSESVARKPSAPSSSSKLIAASVPSVDIFIPEVAESELAADISTSLELQPGFGGSGIGGGGGVAARDGSEGVGFASRGTSVELDGLGASSPQGAVDPFGIPNALGMGETNGITSVSGSKAKKKRADRIAGMDGSEMDPFSSGSTAGDELADYDTDSVAADPFAAPAAVATTEPTARTQNTPVDAPRKRLFFESLRERRRGRGTSVVVGETSKALDSNLDGRREGEVKGGFAAQGFPVTPATPTEFEDAVGMDRSDLNDRQGVVVNREFNYPTEYEPPELPNQVGGGSGGQIATLSDVPVTGRLFQSKPDVVQDGKNEAVDGLADRRRVLNQMDAAWEVEENAAELGGEKNKRLMVGTVVTASGENRQRQTVRALEEIEYGPALKPDKVIDLAKSSGYRADGDIAPEDGLIVSDKLREVYNSNGVDPADKEMAAELGIGSGIVSETAKQELLKRQQVTIRSREIAIEGDKLFESGETEKALEQYQAAMDSLPDGSVTEELRDSYRERLARASVLNAQKKLEEGRYSEAKSLLNDVLLPTVDPSNRNAMALLSKMEDEERYPLVTTGDDSMAEIQRKAKEINRLLKIGESYYQLDDHDSAEKQFDKVLALDPYNKAAQRFHERIERTKIDYYGVAYNRTRSEMLAEVDALWEIKPPNIQIPKKQPSGESLRLNQQRKLERLIIPGVDFRDTTLLEVVQFLRAKTQEIDTDPNPENRGLSIIVASESLPGDDRSEANPENVEIDSIQMREVPLGEVLRTLADKSGMEVKVEEYAVVFVPKKEADPIPQKKPAPQIDLDEIFLEQSAADEGVSTFSLHVNDASFKVAAALLESGQWPDVDKVREEEFVNALDYGDPSPTSAERISAKVEQSAHPFLGGRNLVRIGLRTASVGRDTRMPLHLTILLDTSGSMERQDRREIVVRSLASLSTMLGENDVVSMIGFSRNSRLLIDRVPGTRAGELVKTAMALPAEGGTNIEAALTLASEIAQRQFNAEGQNRVVMLTDGAANLGGAETDRLMAIGSQFREMGVALDCYGVGIDGLDDAVLEALTRKGDGRYFVLNAPQEADEEFAKAVAGTLSPLALDVKVQVRFNPDRVGGYRLVGFRKQRLNEEDFRNDAVDGGEIAAAAEGNALYQVEVVPDGAGDIGEVWVRFRDARTDEMIEKQWRIPYDEKVKSLADSTETMKMAGLAGLFAEALLKGPEIGSDEAGELESLARDVVARRDYDERLKAMAEAVSNAAEL